MDRRRSREIYNKNGFADPHLYSGLYRRAYNPRMHDRPSRTNDGEMEDSQNANWDPSAGWGSP